MMIWQCSALTLYVSRVLELAEVLVVVSGSSVCVLFSHVRFDGHNQQTEQFAKLRTIAHEKTKATPDEPQNLEYSTDDNAGTDRNQRNKVTDMLGGLIAHRQYQLVKLNDARVQEGFLSQQESHISSTAPYSRWGQSDVL